MYGDERGGKKDVHNEEEGADNPRGDTKRAKEPSKSGFDVHSGKGKVERRRQGDLELREGHDDGLHAEGCFGECVFERGDGGEDLGHADQDVRT
jgi:hypothetical protein